jgi:pimeloyl-ACP methyl ester carboxylesterase|tara:strand:+ start:66 stop:1013 length:948 start_codon:yes stop_codon:yes gene_type:complete
MKKALLGFLLTSTVLLSIFLSFNVYLDVPREKIEKKYVDESSKFMILKDESRIHYKDEGNKEGKVLVLVHGFADSLFTFDYMIPELENEFRIVRMDFPAFGLTGKVPSSNYGPEAFVKVIHEVTNNLGIQKFSIIGNSLGGNAAWRYALNYPEQLEGLVLIAAAGIKNEEEKERKLGPKAVNSPLTGWLFRYVMPKFMIGNILKNVFVDESLITSKNVDRFHDFLILEGSREAIISMSTSGGYKNNSKLEIRNITTPTLIIHGANDNIIPVRTHEYFLSEIVNSKALVYDRVGHIPMLEAPIRTSKDIKEFMNRL